MCDLQLNVYVKGSEHLRDRFSRINQLKMLKCVYAEDASFPGYWFMVNATEFPPVPAQPWQDMDVDGAPTLSQPLSTPQWLDNTRPFQGFAPTYGANLGKELSAVRVPDVGIPHMISKTSKGTYMLDAPIASKWTSIESALERIAAFLLIPLEHLPSPRQPRPPSVYGYTSEYPDRESAVASVRLSRDAFDVTLVFISFTLAHWRFHHCTYPLDAALFYFEKHYPDDYPALYDLVMDSCVGDFRVGTRAGYFVDLFTYPGDWIPYLHVWAEAGIPLWIYAGPCPAECVAGYQSESTLIPIALKNWMPNHLILAAAFGKFLTGILHHAPPPPSFDHRDVQGHRLLVPALKSFAIVQGEYEHGTTPEAYFERKNSAIARWKSSAWITEQAISHATRLGDCSEWRARFLGYRMFVWECERGVWHRRVIENSTKRAFFEIHAPSQRYWCPMSQEIDLCWALDISAGEIDLVASSRHPHLLFGASPPNVDTSMTYLSNARMASRPRSPFPSHPVRTTPHSPDPSSTESDYESDYESDCVSVTGRPRSPPRPKDSVQVALVSPRTWQSTLQERLGYSSLTPLPAWHTRRSTPLFRNPQNRVVNALKCLGDFLPANTVLDADQSIVVLDAVDTLGSAGTYGRHLLPARWDISPLRLDKPSLPPNLSSFQIRFDGERGVVRRCVLATSTQAVEDQWWVFSMTGVALLQVLRSGETGMLAIGRYLISRGIPFHTAKATRYLTPRIPRDIARQGLGSLTSEDAFTPARYAHYETQREAALGAGLRSLALKAGGIIWRLSIDSATPRGIKDALRPPSTSPAQKQLICGSSGDHTFVSDHFHPHELDTILGAYRFKKKLPQRPTSRKELSTEEQWSEESIVFLWPTEYAWASSGLNIGEWTHECEAWYQARLSSLRAGTASPMSSTEWRSSLRKLSVARTVWDTYDKLVHDTFFDS